MKPPREQIDKMLAEGRMGEITSMLCLGAALVMKKGGDPPELLEVRDPFTNERFPERLEAAFRDAHRACVNELRNATPLELDHSIALFTEHLKAAGYTVEAGYDH